jgi:hypothetical protein
MKNELEKTETSGCGPTEGTVTEFPGGTEENNEKLRSV